MAREFLSARRAHARRALSVGVTVLGSTVQLVMHLLYGRSATLSG